MRAVEWAHYGHVKTEYTAIENDIQAMFSLVQSRILYSPGRIRPFEVILPFNDPYSVF